MELGSWSLIHPPSLLALIPLAVHVVMVFRGEDNISGVVVGIVIDALMMGQDLKIFASILAASLGSSTALIGVIIMTGAGLGVLMTGARVTHTLVYQIVRRIGVDTQTKAKVTLVVCSILVCGLLGTLGSGSVIIAPILIPLMTTLGITPTMVVALLRVSGEVSLMVGPLTGVTLITMEVIGLSYGQLMMGAVIPFAIFWLGGMRSAIKHTQHHTEGKEFHRLGDMQSINEIVITPGEHTTTIVFLLSFLLLTAYGIMTKQGTSYALVVMIILSAVVGIVGRMDVNHAIESMSRGVTSQVKMFVVFITIDVLLNLVTLSGGFDTISNLLGGAASSSLTAVMLIASAVGGSGIEATAVVEIKIIAEMFGTTAASSGLFMTMFAIAILSATRLTGGIYPTSNMMGQLGIAQSENAREMLEASWISSGAAIVFMIIWTLIGPTTLT